MCARVVGIPEPELIKTHIPQVDAILGGGVPKNALVLIAGTTGTMKSTFVYTILYNNSKFNDTKSLYLSTSKRKEGVMQQMHNIGLNDPTISANIQIIDVGKLRKRSDINKGREWLDLFKRFVLSLKTNFAFELMAIDSITALKYIIGINDYRDSLFEFIEWLRDLDVNVFLVSKMQEGSPQFSELDEDFLVDGIINFKLIPRNDVLVERQLQCVKMRGLANSLMNHPFKYDHNGFQITVTP